MKNNSYVLGIGTANVDIYGKSIGELKTHYDNISKFRTYRGGVTFNILRNLSLLGCKTIFITATGDDMFSNIIRDTANSYGIDMSLSLSCKNSSSGVFMQIMDENNDMYLRMDDMEVFKNITPDYIKSCEDFIKGAEVIVCDPGLPRDTLKTICGYGVPVFIDPTAEGLCDKIKDFIGDFYFVKPNRKELQSLTGIVTDTDDGIIDACKLLLDKGLDSICVSLGESGCLYMSKDGKQIFDSLEPVKEMVNASGRGDSFIARFIYGFINSFATETCIKYGMAAGKLAVKCESSVNENLTVNVIEKELK